MLNYLAAFLWSCELFIAGGFLYWTCLLTYGAHMLLSKVIMLITLQNVHWKWSKNKRGFFMILCRRWPLVVECKTISSSFMVRSYKYSICGMCNFLHTKAFLTSLRWGVYKALCYLASQNEIWSEKTLLWT